MCLAVLLEGLLELRSQNGLPTSSRLKLRPDDLRDLAALSLLQCCDLLSLLIQLRIHEGHLRLGLSDPDVLLMLLLACCLQAGLFLRDHKTAVRGSLFSDFRQLN